ncbi:MAG: hypothetical protein J0I62_06110 [Microbacterium sp.]|nr:hypothetical protein [Microbacterium sp.]
MSSADNRDRGNAGVPGWVLWVSSAALLVVVALLVVIGVADARPTVAPAATGAVPAGLNQATADLLGVSPTATDPVTAPSYRFTDQYGRVVDGRALRGRVVVLTFNDDRCLDQCAMLADDITDRSAAERARAAQVAGPAVSGYVLAALPIAGLLLGTGMGSDPIAVLGSTTVGGALLVIGVALSCGGLVWADRIVRGG